MRNKKFLSTLLAGVMALSMAMPAAAKEIEPGQGAKPSIDGTQVWAGVVYDMDEIHISVTVPTLFAFVVSGTSNTTDGAKAIKVSTEGLYLPNFKVNNVTDATNYQFGTVGAPIDYTDNGAFLTMTNLSTKGTKNGTNTTYAGLPVDVIGSVAKNTSKGQKYWNHISLTELEAEPAYKTAYNNSIAGAADPANPTAEEIKTAVGKGKDALVTAAAGPLGTAKSAFKNYELSVGGIDLDTEKDGRHYMSEPVKLLAQDITDQNSMINNDTKTVLPTVAKQQNILFNVKVGGTRGLYTQIEESVGINTISWDINSEAQTANGPTNPENAPLVYDAATDTIKTK